MNELISGKEALIALANGETIQTKVKHSNTWVDFDAKDENTPVTLFLSGVNRNGFDFDFRLKPRTITINGIEAPKPMSIGWGDPDKSRIDIGFNSEDEAEEFFNKFRGFV